MCTNVIGFLQEEKETVCICTNVIVFSSGGERDCRHLYCYYFSSEVERDYTFVLMLLFFSRRKRL